MKSAAPRPMLPSEDIFRVVWRGWFSGILVIFLPIWALVLIVMAVRGDWTGVVAALGGLLLIPIVAAGQAVVAGGLVLLGLRVWRQNPTRHQD